MHTTKSEAACKQWLSYLHMPNPCQVLKVLDNLLLQNVGRRQVIEVIQTLVFQPKDIQTGLVTRHRFFVAEELEPFASHPLVTIFRVVAGDEILQFVQLERARLQGEMLVCQPDTTGTRFSLIPVFKFVEPLLGKNRFKLAGKGALSRLLCENKNRPSH
jgi:hypothetical protein